MGAAGGADVSVIAAIVGPDPGHALPVLGVSAALVRRGHEVTVWTSGDHRDLAARHGIGWGQLPRIAPTPGDVDAGHRMWARAAPMARDLVGPLAGVDLVLADTLTTGGALVAGLLDVPCVAVVPHHLPEPDDDLPAVGLGATPARTSLGRWSQRRVVAQQRASLAVGARQADEVAAQVGLPAWPRPVARLLQTLPSLEPRRAAWPADAHVVGSLALDPPLPELVPPDGDDPLVVVTDSTATGLADRRLSDVALDGLRDLDLRVVVTTGAHAPRREPRLVVGKGPHAPLFAAADLLVSPGGGGVLTKGAAAGVRHVVVPLAGDQREAAARVVAAGVGRRLSPRRCGPRTLRHAVVRALIDRDADAATARLAAEAAALGPEVAADRVDAVLAGEARPATPPDELAADLAARDPAWPPHGMRRRRGEGRP